MMSRTSPISMRVKPPCLRPLRCRCGSLDGAAVDIGIVAFAAFHTVRAERHDHHLALAIALIQVLVPPRVHRYFGQVAVGIRAARTRRWLDEGGDALGAAREEAIVELEEVRGLLDGLDVGLG